MNKDDDELEGLEYKHPQLSLSLLKINNHNICIFCFFFIEEYDTAALFKYFPSALVDKKVRYKASFVIVIEYLIFIKTYIAVSFAYFKTQTHSHAFFSSFLSLLTV